MNQTRQSRSGLCFSIGSEALEVFRGVCTCLEVQCQNLGLSPLVRGVGFILTLGWSII